MLYFKQEIVLSKVNPKAKESNTSANTFVQQRKYTEHILKYWEKEKNSIWIISFPELLMCSL